MKNDNPIQFLLMPFDKDPLNNDEEKRGYYSILYR